MSEGWATSIFQALLMWNSLVPPKMAFFACEMAWKRTDFGQYEEKRFAISKSLFLLLEVGGDS